jgi:hypothetical protein
MVHIDVLGDTYGVDPDNPPPITGGVAIAHLVNMDDRDNEAYFDLRPHTAADYYVWVDDNGAKKSRYTLLQVAGDTVSATKQWNVKPCHHRRMGVARGPSDFDFYEFKYPFTPCARSYPLSNTGVSSASLFSVTPFRQLFARVSAMLRGEMTALQGSWIECSSGCCT